MPRLLRFDSLNIEKTIEDTIIVQLNKRYGAIRFIIDDIKECCFINTYYKRHRNLY